MDHFLSKDIFTDYGITVIDRSASYARDDGYWNGNIWMPYQWFFWKTLLDLGYFTEAQRIVEIALDVWKRDTEADYRCRELFSGINGTGSGWNLFGGLSAPIVSWFEAYFVPGSINVGFDNFILNRKFNENHTEASITIKKNIDTGSLVLVCMNDEYDYQCVLDGNKVEVKESNKGAFYIQLPEDKGEYNISISKSN